MGKRFIFVLLFGLSMSAQAEIFKCTDATGNVSFQAQPCADNQNTERKKETDSERMQRLEHERLAEQKKRIQEQQSQASKTSPTSSNLTSASDKQYWNEVDTPDEIKQATRDYLNEILRDPASLKDLEWIQTVDGIGEHKALINYRATNVYGGYVKSEKVIRINRDGEVIGFKDYVPLPLWMQ